MKKVYQSLAEQTVFDVALMHYGDVEGVAWLLQDNPDSINEEGIIPNGLPYAVGSEVKSSRVVVGYNGYVPVTDGTLTESFVLIDNNGDYLIDDLGETPISPL